MLYIFLGIFFHVFICTHNPRHAILRAKIYVEENKMVAFKCLPSLAKIDKHPASPAL